MLRRAVLISAVLFTLTAHVFASTRTWDNGAVPQDNLWSNKVNWSNDKAPTIADNATVGLISGPIIDYNTATGYQIRVGASSNANLTMTKGTLNVGQWLMIGTDVGGQPGTFIMNGGTINLGQTSAIDGHLWIGYMNGGTFTMNGGTINVLGKFGLAYTTGSSAVVHLDGGTITANYFTMKEKTGSISAAMDITNGTLIVNGDIRTTISGYGNWITAFGGSGILSVDYDNVNPGKTTITAYQDFRKARTPIPANYAANVPLNAQLNWTAGSGATSHKVYFGTTSPGTFQGTQTAATFNPGTLQSDTTYYWRIDEVSGPNTVTGIVWSFTTATGRAQNPNPANGVSNVLMDKVLQWTPGAGAVSHDIYLSTNLNDVNTAGRLAADLNSDGQVDWKDLSILSSWWLQDPTGSNPYGGVNNDNIVDYRDFALLAADWMTSSSAYKGNSSSASYNPGQMTAGSYYYWRIDERNGSDIHRGNVWSFKTTSGANTTLTGKVMCGYQGWFACPGDGSNRNWVHWSTSSSLFDYTTPKIEMWPDTSEYARKYQATGFTLGLPPYYVFSSYDSNTVKVHFKWMRDYGIDGVFVQRFGSDLGSANFLNTILSNAKTAANMYGRTYAVMYDLTNYTTASLAANIEADWVSLENNLGISTDPLDESYAQHNGKPVIAIYGIFGTNVSGYPDPALCAPLIQWFKDRGFTVLIGVNNDWRTRTFDTNFQLCVTKADIIMPWNVGRYDNVPNNGKIDVGPFCSSNWVPDLNSCNSRGKDYSICVFPGFSWNNWNGGGFNQIPRQGGQFLWDQYYLAKSIGATMIYQAMFDEVDEATAIFKVSNNPPPPYNGKQFLTLEGLPSDEYLWLVGQGGRMLRGEISLTPTRPAR